MSALDPSAEQLTAQEAELVFDAFDNDVAWLLGLHLVGAAREQRLAVSVSIRRAGRCLFHAALPGTSADNDAWLERKSRVVERFGRSSLAMGAASRAAGRVFAEQYLLPEAEYAAHGGAFPVTLRGTGVVGVVAVSGLPQREDHAFVVEQLRSFLATTRRATTRRATTRPATTSPASAGP